MRNGKKTAILAVMDEAAKKKPEKKKDSRLYYVYRPNTGQQVKQVGHIYINVFDVAMVSTKVGLDVRNPLEYCKLFWKLGGALKKN